MLLPPPVGGGDSIEWSSLQDSSFSELPEDYRDFVEIYGGGEIDEYLSISTPPIPGSAYGDLFSGTDPSLGSDGSCELEGMVPDIRETRLLPVGFTASGDVIFWLCEGKPSAWRIVVFKRQSPYGQSRWAMFDGGLVEFLVSLLEGKLEPFSETFCIQDSHSYVSWRD
ncbi:SMI1/KNR4 family protein [Streptomyces niveiscabiei]|uniref:SMI1/KNR4 family protein n=1 Tax=Streptomyces niveiscabiei TaxID=164115 RepID=UPI001F0A858E|nr:SMI1/KNR4 family protein [Streptomyces niveiscabiei]